jgi:NADH:ubiquinone oxidoreductase subunit 3 (subunit A)
VTLLAPPLAFVAYLALVGVLLGISRVLTGHQRHSRAGAMTYASGEHAPTGHPSPGYGPFYAAALFFAIMHVGVLLASTGSLTPTGVAYLAGLSAVLIVVRSA